MAWSWTADGLVPPAAPIIPQVLCFGPKQPASPDWHLIRRGLRPNRLIYVNCIINTKQLALLPSGSTRVKISKVPGFTEGRCSGPSTPDFMTKKELSPCWGELFGAGALTPQIQRDPDETARFTFNSDYVNMLLASQTKQGTPCKLSAATLATIVIQMGAWASFLMRWTMFCI